MEKYYYCESCEEPALDTMMCTDHEGKLITGMSFKCPHCERFQYIEQAGLKPGKHFGLISFVKNIFITKINENKRDQNTDP